MNKSSLPLFSIFRLGISIHNFNKRSEEKVGLSLVQWCLLEQLIDMPRTSAFALAKSLGIHPSTLTQTLKRLEKKGYIFQTEDPRDSRKKVISITKAGKLILERIATQMVDWSASLEPLVKDLHDLISLLQKR